MQFFLDAPIQCVFDCYRLKPKPSYQLLLDAYHFLIATVVILLMLINLLTGHPRETSAEFRGFVQGLGFGFRSLSPEALGGSAKQQLNPKKGVGFRSRAPRQPLVSCRTRVLVPSTFGLRPKKQNGLSMWEWGLGLGVRQTSSDSTVMIDDANHDEDGGGDSDEGDDDDDDADNDCEDDDDENDLRVKTRGR